MRTEGNVVITAGGHSIFLVLIGPDGIVAQNIKDIQQNRIELIEFLFQVRSRPIQVDVAFEGVWGRLSVAHVISLMDLLFVVTNRFEVPQLHGARITSSQLNSTE